jgi:hypothetical protein
MKRHPAFGKIGFGLWKIAKTSTHIGKYVVFLSQKKIILKGYRYYYSPENHSVIRCGNGVSYRPNLDENTYQQHLKAHVETTFSLSDVCIPYINKIFNSVSHHMSAHP